MPFTALVGNRVTWPDKVADDASLKCTSCGEMMHVRRSHRTYEGVFKPRCFVHNPDTDSQGCSGGESDEHKLMKYVVSRNFAHLFEHAEVDREVKIGDTGRIADVCAEFDHPQLPLGRGVIGEVQYRNTSKDIEVVTEDYLRAGYSVYWIDETDFGEDYRTFELPEIVRAWPNALQSANEWSGYEEPVVEIRSLEPAQYPIPLRMPPEFMEKHREELRDYWKLGAGELDYDIIRRLTYNNADRRCSTCGESADYYLYKDGIFNDFRCVKHASVDEDSK